MELSLLNVTRRKVVSLSQSLAQRVFTREGQKCNGQNRVNMKFNQTQFWHLSIPCKSKRIHRLVSSIKTSWKLLSNTKTWILIFEKVAISNKPRIVPSCATFT